LKANEIKRLTIPNTNDNRLKKEVAMFLSKEINELYNSFADKVYEENTLNKKVKELIALSCSVMADCVPCINWHYEKAVEAGALKEEIAEALAISMSVSAGSKRAKYSELVINLGQNKK